MKLVSHSAGHTRFIGEALALQLQPGDVLLLSGPMGAGKSELARGVARGLGVRGYVTSPAFTILQAHEDGRLPLYHFDWYRLSSPEELYELSMDEYLHMNGVAIVEWPDRAAEALPARCLNITLTPLDENERVIDFVPEGGFRPLDGEALRRAERSEPR